MKMNNVLALPIRSTFINRPFCLAQRVVK